ncbi:aspartyl/asparaginyl beta-hydroxylase domain-containing protein [Crocosphaera sp. XPORK-15E]|uniref:aspartyl/asparaginyl beta-hydroxylase domain-containing protein n=1 Tax=Crocosphaera sp. XPORK-15E TaxID=3110247 RepID=UPI002B214B29|nr:aspartyl/asparaginyl beta-hydroxylase domain-containing protein [Crocosphaera sp. XPORK-15E]MEA5534268.1 aspartyl/asparaginyl beta-hydroxylase domain-containing protein [Crocosphaera sp. XPORK-15E]
MKSYNEYFLDPKQFTFLKSFQENWQVIRDEFTNFMNEASDEELKFTNEVMSPKSKTIKTKDKAKYTAFGILFQGLFLEEYIQKHHILYPDYGSSVTEKVWALQEKYFSNLTELIKQVNLSYDHILRNVYFGIFHPGLDIKLHVNYNPHINRGYLGLIVPQGDVAMKICHDKYYWYEGEFMVLDHSYPHSPHNYTDKDRVVLVIDFFKTNKPREEVEEFEQNLVTERMRDNPYSLGIFGQSDRAQEEDFIKYGLAHQLEWDKTLTTPL